jgi:hypothetical protein
LSILAAAMHNSKSKFSGVLWKVIGMAQLPSEFANALLSAGPHREISLANQIFAPFVGSWQLQVSWFGLDGCLSRQELGEWHFSWVLEGRAIQDIWIVPPREARNQRLDLYEYGTSLRFFDPEIDAWRSTWIGPMHSLVRTFTASKIHDQVVLQTTEGTEPRMRWSLSEIAARSFTWRNEVLDNGRWRLQQSFRAQRAAVAS